MGVGDHQGHDPFGCKKLIPRTRSERQMEEVGMSRRQDSAEAVRKAGCDMGLRVQRDLFR